MKKGKKRIAVEPEPHEIEVTPDCRNGHYWVVEGRTGELLTKIRTDQKEIWSVCGDLLRIHETSRNFAESGGFAVTF